MLLRHILKNFFLTSILLTVYAADSLADKGRIEYNTTLNSDTVTRIHSVIAYSRLMGNSTIKSYGGLELAWIQLDNDTDFRFNTRVLLGLSTHSRFAPFVELGTNLIDLVDLFSGEARDCSQQDECDPDGDIKVGLRVAINPTFYISSYYQGIHFGGFHNRLSGNHNIYGASIGLQF